jgi:hypothetical protein
MKRNLLIGLLTILGLALIIMNPLFGGALALIFWIYLVWVVQTKKASVFEGHPDPSLAEKLFGRLKAFLLLAGVAFVAFVVGTIAHNVLSGPSKSEETVWFIVALVALAVFILATFYGLYTLFRGRRQTRRG